MVPGRRLPSITVHCGVDARDALDVNSACHFFLLGDGLSITNSPPETLFWSDAPFSLYGLSA